MLVAVGQRLPAWADAVFDDYAKRMPPELRLELKTVKAEARGAKSASQLMAAEATRIEAALPRGARRIALDERGDRVTSVELAARIVAWQRDGPRRGAGRGWSRRARPGPEGELRREPAPVGPDAAARVRPRARRRGALPRVDDHDRPSVSPRVMRVKRAAFVYLASQSPRRRQLLEQIGVRCEMLLAADDEDAEALEATVAFELPRDYVERVTRAKLTAAIARRAARGLVDAPILCADTTVALGRTIFGKPVDAHDAVRMLSLLAGRAHRVLTSVAVATGLRTRLATSVSHVRFAAVSRAAIERYVASGEPFGKAGAYAIQGAAAAWIERIDGSYTGIMGLPLHETAALLDEAGIDVRP